MVVASAIGASHQLPAAHDRHRPPHGGGAALEDWQRLGPDIPLLVDCQPAGRFLGEAFHRAGGVPAVMRELLEAGKLHGDVMTVTRQDHGARTWPALAEPDREVIRRYDKPMMEQAGFVVLSGNLFDSAVMKISVIDKEFRKRFLSDAAGRVRGQGRRVRGAGGLPRPHRGPSLGIDEKTVLVIRNCGPVGYPGSAEVVNMQPPAALIKGRHRRRCRPWATGARAAPRPAPPSSTSRRKRRSAAGWRC